MGKARGCQKCKAMRVVGGVRDGQDVLSRVIRVGLLGAKVVGYLEPADLGRASRVSAALRTAVLAYGGAAYLELHRSYCGKGEARYRTLARRVGEALQHADAVGRHHPAQAAASPSGAQRQQRARSIALHTVHPGVVYDVMHAEGTLPDITVLDMLAEVGHLRAMHNTAGLYYTQSHHIETSAQGTSVGGLYRGKPPPAIALMYYRAAAAGNVHSFATLGELTQLGVNPKYDLKYFEERFQDDADIARLAHASYTGFVHRLHVHANYYLGRLFEEGSGVERCLDTAAWYYRWAADGGCWEAQIRLAMLHIFTPGRPAAGGRRRPRAASPAAAPQKRRHVDPEAAPSPVTPATPMTHGTTSSSSMEFSAPSAPRDRREVPPGAAQQPDARWTPLVESLCVERTESAPWDEDGDHAMDGVGGVDTSGDEGAARRYDLLRHAHAIMVYYHAHEADDAALSMHFAALGCDGVPAAACLTPQRVKEKLAVVKSRLVAVDPSFFEAYDRHHAEADADDEVQPWP
eukprot:TRINITY_DN27294_c0_g1_i1.p1 TRINITY_DN27294_c0_g1~~TRINITY_DN27294_c0_g1_i1.p1  ORF type:complete len:518 (+),score=123.57 TRINITY_DN27294_c0_g1_i1:93-1646(+)